MKKRYSFTYAVILLSISFPLFAQDNNTFPGHGNVGIGTLSPTEKLDVKGNVLWDSFNSGNPRAVKIGYSGGNYGGVGYNLDFTGTTGVFNRPFNDQSSYLEFWNGGFRFFGSENGNSAQGINLNGSGANLKMLATIARSGNFGIGTDNPTHKLTVDGDIKLINQNNGLLIYYSSLSETISGASTILGNNVKAGAIPGTVKRFSSPNDPGSYVSLNYYHGITFHTGVRSLLNTDISELDNEAMRITQVGDVGIGTPYPGGYKLAVNGKIRAHEIKVEAAPWPDYVFAEDYKLPSLDEIEKYIKEKGHLPGIPSAEEVKANGIDLGEMNAKLLQKIEELTLQLINQSKIFESKLIAQQKEINTLKSTK